MRQIRFRALIMLDSAEMHPATPLHPAAKEFPNNTRAFVVRVRNPRVPGHIRSFASEVCWDDEQPLHPGDNAVVTITVRDEDADTFLDAGQRFTLWARHEVGHGVISRRIFFEQAPC